MHPTLRISSGFPDVSPHLREEVKTLQRALRDWGFGVTPDGLFGPGTDRAVRSFQRRQGLTDDGIVGPRTWDLVLGPRTPGIGTSVRDAPVLTGPECFPLAKLPTADWTHAPRAFGSNRSGGHRAHAACDLYAPLGTWIYAITDGEVIRGPYPFYNETYALEVHHGSFIARYGEIQRATMVREGQRVKGGQPIARVGHLVGVNVASDMLHLELYRGTMSGDLTVYSGGAKRHDGVPYQRRGDLLDPTPYLRRWATQLPYE
ncbi:MAG TPA: peptidoglycan-binding protein [Polyangium sp.]|nr:peptidoglycan-binding protein [Polyangium sp.]